MASAPSGSGTGPALPRLAPMLATPGPLPPRGRTGAAEWAYEVKWDGVRALAELPGDGGVRLVSRSGREVTAAYPDLAGIAPPGLSAVLDGEIVALDEAGRPDFGRLQQRMGLTRPAAVRTAARTWPVTLMVFDVLHLDGRPTLDLPYTERRRLLEALPLGGPRVAVPPSWPPGQGRAALAWTLEHGLEGVVAKRVGSRYEPGRRSRDWIKTKHVRTVDVRIGGWVPQDAGARAVRSLLVGVPAAGGLVYAGSVGTGFSHAESRRLAGLLRPLEVPDPPFADRVVTSPGHPPRWVRPELGGEVEYLEWTRGGRLRAPVWRGLREPPEVALH
ncbi:non-homologous end-joining DNA ligase [Streptomyces pactum]|uniref:DNA ligase (ATP) n=1 Tax=Streptomyces pactum TaxID=68249 RepID=A0ABS0NSF7_9ACTN|nr:non-homologous end-joining DNA ligase [Streptomyces pactum]MBH5338157.1 non-homologous end-joining DNA ligase [Streptomyces pactum]